MTTDSLIYIKARKSIFCRIVFIISVLLLVHFSSCKKEPGQGGKASISGKVLLTEYYENGFNVVRQYYSAREEVYIIYGDDITYGDGERTDENGYYRFNYLRPGKYTLYVYSDDTSGSSGSGKVTIIKEVEITGKKDDVTVEDFKIADLVSVDDGSSGICGKVLVWDWNATFTSREPDPFFGQDYWIYIVYNNEPTYFDRIRSSYDGSYCFEQLIPGHYEVYAYSDTLKIPGYESGSFPVLLETNITSDYQSVTLSNLVIND